jgi:hypothetical protein
MQFRADLKTYLIWRLTLFEATNIFILTRIQKKPRRKPCGFFGVYDGGNGVFSSIKKKEVMWRQQISQTVLPQLVTRCPEIFPSS